MMTRASDRFPSGRRHVGRRNLSDVLPFMSLQLILGLAVFVERAPAQAALLAEKEAGASPLARYVPRKDLLAYLEFDGFDAHDIAWRASAAHKLLTETKLGALLEEFVLQGIEISQETTPPEQRVASADVIGLVKHIARKGFVLGVSRKAPGHFRFVVVLHHADRPEFQRVLEIFGGR